MKQTYRSVLLVMAVAATLLNACGAMAAAPDISLAPVAAKVDASIIAFTGVIESMDGNQWTINGQTLTVEPALVQNGPFQVGDTVKVEGVVNADGSFTVSSIESPSASDLAGSPTPDITNTNDNTNANVNANDNSNINDNTNDDEDDASINANANDDEDDDANSNDADSDDDASDANSNGSSTSGNGNGGSGHSDGNGGGHSDDDSQGGGHDGGGDDD
ncbi:MAG: hypothetical protein Fur0043_27790 [Anaerolineales bacterium]